MEHRVFVAAPTGCDTEVLCHLLDDAGIENAPCAEIGELCRQIENGAAAVILAEEVLTRDAKRRLIETLSRQPEWSDLPLIVMAAAGDVDHPGWSLLTDLNGGGHSILLQRPVPKVTLLSSVRAAIQSRVRQYQVRDELVRQKQAQETLRESEERFRMLADAAPVLIWMSGPDKEGIYFNRPWLEFTGKPAEEQAGEGWLSLVHPEDRQPLFDTCQEAFRRREPFTTEFRLRRADGEYRWLLDTGTPRFEPSGAFSGFIGSCVDITDRKQAEEALRDSEERLRLALEAGRMGTWEWSVQTNRVVWSPGLEAIHGLKPGAFGGTFEDYQSDIHPDDRERVMSSIARALKTGAPFQTEYRIIWPDESLHWVEGRGQVFRGESGEPVRLVGICADITRRKQAEEALEAREAELDLVARTTPLILTRCSRDLRYLFANRAAAALFGCSPDQMIGRPIVEVMGEKALSLIKPRIEQVLRGERVEFEDQIPYKAAGLRWVRVNYLPERDERGEVVGWVASVVDITDLKHAEESLRIRARQQQVVARLGELALREGDLQKVFERVTGQVVETLEVEYCKVLELLPGRLEMLLRAGVGWKDGLVGRAVVGTGLDSQAGYTLAANAPVVVEDLREEKRFIGPTLLLEHGVVSGISCIIRDTDGSPWGVLGAHATRRINFTWDDVSFLLAVANILGDAIQRERAESALRESEERFRTLADNMSQLAWMADPTGSLFWYNQRWYDYTGTTLEEMQGWGWKKVHHPDHVERVVERVQRAWDTGEPWEDLFPLRGKDGNYRWFLSRAVPIRDAAGNVARWFGTNTDVHERRQAEDALREADRRKDEFLAMLAHELRNPLAPIRNTLELLKRANGDERAIWHARETIDAQVGHMVRLIDDLLDVSRITRDKLVLNKGPVELASVIHQAIELARPLADRERQVIEISLPRRPIHLDADPVRLAQVFSNLLNNACKYSKADGRIHLTAERQADEVLVSVKDNGLGIPPDKLERIFEMFAQVEGPLERSQPGLGIGLTLAKRLVELHGGSIAARSEGLGRGSEFVVRLPVLVETPQPTTPEATTGAEARVASSRILVVDDSRASAVSLAELLKLSGHAAHVAHDGPEAVEMAGMLRPDVILLDIGLPGMNGYDVCRVVREQPWGRTMVVIALTGWGQDEDRRRTREAGFDGHLVKPIEYDVLTDLLAELRPSPV